LKACGLFTGAAKKRNRFIERNSVTATAYASIFTLVRWHRAIVIVPFAQFIQQLLEVGREVRGLRGKVLLQPFTDGIADRSARLAIEWFAVVVDKVAHDGVPLRVNFKEVTQDQVMATGIVSRRSPNACILSKH
jgi:hypothetical protein